MFKTVGILVGLFFLSISGTFAEENSERSIINITGDLYRFSEGNTHGVFLVTKGGIVLADPVNSGVATWLKQEFKERFDQEVKVVIYSHHHADHTSGGEVFKDTATYFANERAKEKIIESGHTPPPDQTFDGAITFKLGGKPVELYYFYPSHTDNLISILFPEEKVLFQVDSVAVKRLPYRDLNNFSINGAIQSLKFIQSLDFEILIPGHGEIGDKQDLVDHRIYLIELNTKILEALKKGKTLEEAKQTILMEKYKNWTNYEEWRELNVEGAYNYYNKLGYFPIEKRDPIYPRHALLGNFCGWVIVEYDITLDGTTENVRVFESSPAGIFDKAAIKAAEKYKYITIKPVEGVQTRITFELQKKCRVLTEMEIERLKKRK